MYAFLWEKKHVTNCLYILAPCKVFFLFFYTKSSIVWHSPLLITTSLINFESVTLEFIMQNIYCSRRKTFFLNDFFFLSNIWTLFKTARKGSGKITEGVGKYQKNQLKHKNCTKMLRSMITGEKKNLSTMLQFKSWKKEVRDFLPHVSKCHPIFLKQG